MQSPQNFYQANCPVPFLSPIQGGVTPGFIVQLCVTPNPNASFFAINLQCGPNTNPRDDIALHIMPKFEGGMSRVVRNSLQMQQWGIEEAFGHFPFQHNQTTELMILADDDHFKLAINGEHFGEFKYRMPLNRISHVAIDGECNIQSIRYENEMNEAPMQLHSQGSQMGANSGYGGMPNPTMQQGYSDSGYPSEQMQQINVNQDEGIFSRSKGGNNGGGNHNMLKMAGVGIGGALAGAAISRLMYPKKGHSGFGSGGKHGKSGGMMGFVGKHGKHKKMKKMGKVKKSKKHGKKSSGSSSSSSSSSSSD